MRTRYAVLVALSVAALASAAPSLAASPEGQLCADTGAAVCTQSPAAACVASPLGGGLAVATGKPLPPDPPPFVALAEEPSPCLCSQGACCGCNPCPPDGQGYCCAGGLIGGGCTGIKLCNCLRCAALD